MKLCSAPSAKTSANSARPNGLGRADVKIVGNPMSGIRSDFRPPTSDLRFHCKLMLGKTFATSFLPIREQFLPYSQKGCDGVSDFNESFRRI